MADPLTLALVSSTVVTEGIKFLYGQGGEILKRWRERKDATAKEETAEQKQIEPAQVELPAAFEGQLTGPQIHFDVVDRVTEQLRSLRRDLADYADDIETVDMRDEALLQRVDAFRRLLEAVYQQRLTFKGEQRPPSGPTVEGRIEVKEVLGYAAAVRATRIMSGQVTAEGKADRVGPGGEFVTVDVETIGDSSP